MTTPWAKCLRRLELDSVTSEDLTPEAVHTLSRLTQLSSLKLRGSDATSELLQVIHVVVSIF